MAFKLLKSEAVFSGRAFKIRRDTLELPDRRTTRLDIVEHIGSVILVPLDENGNLLFVRQYRHAAGLDLLELPAGTLDEGEEPDACAHRELREETGMRAESVRELGSFYLAPGYSTELMHVFLATGLHPDPLEADEDEFLSVERLSIEQAFGLASKGDLPDAKTLAALYLAQNQL
jgi:ADP-ribose pyrophosphatase